LLLLILLLLRLLFKLPLKKTPDGKVGDKVFKSFLSKVPMAAAALVIAVLAFPPTASADLVYNAAILAPAQGFGTAPRDLTLQSQGNNTTESGGIGYNGTIQFGSVISDASVFLGNGVTNTSGTADLPNPLADDQKYGVPTTGSLGITSASQIGILFNATEPSGDSVNVVDVTLKFYTSGGTFLGAIDGSQSFASSNPGNGVAGFTFVVSQTQQAQVNSWLATGGAGTTLALEASLQDVTGGPESFLVYNLNTLQVPEPTSIMLLGVGLTALGIVRRRR
jgi:hypothetical protein